MASTSSSQFFQNFADTALGLATDYARARYIDVERTSDDRNMPDNVDLREGVRGDDGRGVVSAPGGIPWLGWLALGVAVIAGAYLLKRA